MEVAGSWRRGAGVAEVTARRRRGWVTVGGGAERLGHGEAERLGSQWAETRKGWVAVGGGAARLRHGRLRGGEAGSRRG